MKKFANPICASQALYQPKLAWLDGQPGQHNPLVWNPMLRHVLGTIQYEAMHCVVEEPKEIVKLFFEGLHRFRLLVLSRCLSVESRVVYSCWSIAACLWGSAV